MPDPTSSRGETERGGPPSSGEGSAETPALRFGDVQIPLGKLLADALVPVYVKDPEGKYVYANAAYESAVGIPRDDVIGRTDFDLFPSPIAANYRQHDLLVMHEATSIHIEEAAVLEGNEQHYLSIKFPLFADGDLLGIFGISVLAEPRDAEGGSGARKRIAADINFDRSLTSLTPQEARVLDLLVRGLSDKEIADELSLESGTVRHHVSHLLKKLHKRRIEAIIEMLRRQTDRGRE